MKQLGWQDRQRSTATATATTTATATAIALFASTLSITPPSWGQTAPDATIELPPPPTVTDSPSPPTNTVPWDTNWGAPSPVPLPSTAAPTAPSTSSPSTSPQTIRAIDFLPPERTEAAPAPITQQPASAQPSPRYKPKGLSFYIGTRVPNPTAAQGPTRIPVTRSSSDMRAETNVTVGAQYVFNDRERIATEIRGGPTVLGLYFGYLQLDETSRTGWGFNGFNQRSQSIALEGGDPEVDLPGDNEPWVHRMGGGIQGYFPVDQVDASIGVNYQNVSVQDDIFASGLEPVDERGNPLTLSDSGEDDLLTVNFASQYDTRNDINQPTTGSRLRFGVDQSIPIGDAAIAMTRLSGSATQFLPLNGLSFTDDPDVLVLNVQGGHIFGDAPFYESFSLGGANSVRGYSRGEVGTGRSYLQATAEYRFPISEVLIFDKGIDLGGLLFVDYGTTLDSQDNVFGQPGIVRGKPGDGFGFGGGLRARFAEIVGRLEFGISDDGDANVYFVLGERF
ncbi:MAG: BamA/TamA family outer membrane protein [Thainema sp.]